MRGREMLETIENLNPAYIEAASEKPKAKKAVWIKWGAMEACFCLVVVGAVYMMSSGAGSRSVLQWSKNFPTADYFKYSAGDDDVSSSNSIADSAIQYAETRYFSDYREQMEADGVIPAMPDHPLYDCVVRYKEDGSIFSVTHAWNQRGDTYSDLTITIGYQEVELIQDCITGEVDENGNMVPPSTVTERDGIQIANSWGDGYESMVDLLDWVWEHSVDFEMFTIEQGVETSNVNLADYPGAFADQIPDFEALGYFLGGHYLQLKDGKPYTFEGHYYTGVDPVRVEGGSYLELEGSTEIHWCVNAQPDYCDLQNSMGDISEMTQAQVTEVLTERSNFSFMLDDVFVKVYCKDGSLGCHCVTSSWRGKKYNIHRHQASC